MDQVRFTIRGLRQENIHQKRFVPDAALFQLMTDELVHRILENLQIGVHRREEIAGRITRSGKKILAILILSNAAAEVLKFIEADELRDQRLPFKIEILRREIGLSDPDEFEERQWEFVAPVFNRGTLNRSFRLRMILPFTVRDEVGHGAFGRVYRVQLQQDHQEPQDSFPQDFVQKELESADAHRLELENLVILNHLKHPNIVELLSSYTYQGKHHLLFPRAEHGTLATLFRSERSGSHFFVDATFLSALARLSSAIEHVHRFFEQRLDLDLIGCHHDLRPQNILVSGAHLILADFGLCRFKDASEDSNTPFRLGIGDYLAPECENLDETFEPHRIGRSSDIWSFGCILLEAVVYIVHGGNAVEQFRAARKFRVGPFELHLFHRGPDQESEVVKAWISDLQPSLRLSTQMLVTTIGKMLSMDPVERPTAAEVTSRLCLVAIAEKAAVVGKLLEDLKTGANSVDIDVEHMRFEAWKYATGVSNAETDMSTLWSPVSSQYCPFEPVMAGLQRMQEHVEWQLQHGRDVKLSFSQLSLLNDHLVDLLVAEQQERCRIFFRISLGRLPDSWLVERDANDDSSLSLAREVRMTASLKHMTKLVMESSSNVAGSALIEPQKVLVREERFGEHNLGRVREGDETYEVLVEWRKYGGLSANEAVSQELFVRQNALARLFSAEKPKAMRALCCRGYFHHEHRRAFGMLYDLPRSSDPGAGRVQSTNLRQWISETTSKTSLWPVLDDRYRLAQALAKSVLEFHLVGWVHKNLTASNIAFFSAGDTFQEERVKDCYIIGFNHSRQNDPAAFTVPSIGRENLGYQHPRYRRETWGYKPEFDYYSLGVVLLEIGLWRPLKELVGSKDADGMVHRQKLRDRIPLLKPHMGQDYHDAVSVCLNTDFGSQAVGHDLKHNNGVLVAFEQRVLQTLNRHFGHPGHLS